MFIQTTREEDRQIYKKSIFPQTEGSFRKNVHRKIYVLMFYQCVKYFLHQCSPLRFLTHYFAESFSLTLSLNSVVYAFLLIKTSTILEQELRIGVGKFGLALVSIFSGLATLHYSPLYNCWPPVWPQLMLH